MIVTAHQPNYLPGVSVVNKIAASDAVIWLDEVQFSHGGWANRNRLPNGTWLTVPIVRETDMAAFNRVMISEHGTWRRDHMKSLRQYYRYDGELIAEICDEIERPYRLLVGLNLAILRIVLSDTDTAWHFQSHLDGGRPVKAVLGENEDHRPISERLATMVAELGGDTYLSGPSGFRYLDETPFAERGIKVTYWEHHGPNPCALSAVCETLRNE